MPPRVSGEASCTLLRFCDGSRTTALKSDDKSLKRRSRRRISWRSLGHRGGPDAEFPPPARGHPLAAVHATHVPADHRENNLCFRSRRIRRRRHRDRTGRPDHRRDRLRCRHRHHPLRRWPARTRISLRGALLTDRLAGILLTPTAVILLANGFTDLRGGRAAHRVTFPSRTPAAGAGLRGMRLVGGHQLVGRAGQGQAIEDGLQVIVSEPARDRGQPEGPAAPPVPAELTNAQVAPARRTIAIRRCAHCQCVRMCRCPGLTSSARRSTSGCCCRWLPDPWRPGPPGGGPLHVSVASRGGCAGRQAAQRGPVVMRRWLFFVVRPATRTGQETRRPDPFGKHRQLRRSVPSASASCCPSCLRSGS